MATFLYRVEPTRPAMLGDGPTPEEAKAVEDHFLYLRDLVEEGVVFMAGRTHGAAERTFGICFFESDDEAAARAIMDADPAVVRGVMRAELFPFRAALWSERKPPMD